MERWHAPYIYIDVSTSTEHYMLYYECMSLRLRVCSMSSGLDALFDGLERTLSVQDTADLLGMTKPGVYKWLKDGVIPGYKVGSTWFILRDELKETLKSGANVHRDGTPLAFPTVEMDSPSNGE